MDDLRKRYIALAARDPKAKNPASMTYSEVSKAVARYEAALPAADPAGKQKGKADMARPKKVKAEAEEVKANGKRKPGRPKGAKAKGKTAKAKPAASNGRLRTGVGATIRALIAKDQDMGNAEVAEKAKKAHPDSSTNAQCVAWYRNDMRKKGEIKQAKA